MLSPQGVEDVERALRERGPRGVLARGLGRAYGDAAQNAGGAVLDMTGLRAIHDRTSSHIDSSSSTSSTDGRCISDAFTIRC